jgi:epoxyqueuosine reductase QueG
MNHLEEGLTAELTVRGAAIVAFGDITALPPDVRGGLPVGVSVAVKYPKEVIRGIADLPTAEYYEWYNRLNERLDALVTYGAKLLRGKGYEAIRRHGSALEPARRSTIRFCRTKPWRRAPESVGSANAHCSSRRDTAR